MGFGQPSYPQTQTSSVQLSPAQQGYQSAAANYLAGQVGQSQPYQGNVGPAQLSPQAAQSIGQIGAVGQQYGAGAQAQGLSDLSATAGQPQYGLNTLNQTAGQFGGLNALGTNANQYGGLNALNTNAGQYGGLNALNQMAQQGTGLNALNKTAAGGYLFDPFTANELQSTANYANSQFQEQIPELETPFMLAGQTGGSSPAQQYLGQQQANFQLGLQNQLAQQALGSYQTERGLQQQAALQGAGLQQGAAGQVAGLQQGAAGQLAGLQSQAANALAGYQQGAAAQSANLQQQAANLAATQGGMAQGAGLSALQIPQQLGTQALSNQYNQYLNQLQNSWVAALGLPSLASQPQGQTVQSNLYGASPFQQITGLLGAIL